jgi:hypothetical protein
MTRISHKTKRPISDREKYYELGRENKAPMGVSQWRNHGEKYGYWDWFIQQEHKRLHELIRQRMILEANTPLKERKSGWQILIEVRDEIIVNDKSGKPA